MLKIKNENSNLKSINIGGITLISLIITIVVLIMLASVGMYLSLGNNGIFTRAKEAKEETNKQTATEKINLKITTAQMDKYAEEQRMPTLKELSLSLKEDNEIQYVTEQSKRKVASTEYNVPNENPSSIFTKLNEYPYEFEINGSLQLASIDGVQIVATTTPTPENTPSNSQNTMSGEEHFTGEYYFNGKPLYEKTIYISALASSAKDSYYNHNIDNVDIIWVDTSKTYMVTALNGATATLFYFGKSASNSVEASMADKEKFRIITGSNRSNCSAYVTLRFTKTTDTGNGNTITPTPAN